MDNRAAKLALARKKLKDHQEKKHVIVQKLETMDKKNQVDNTIQNQNEDSEVTVTEYQADIYIKSQNNGNNELQPKTNNDLDMNVTEMLICNKRNLETQVTELKSSVADLDVKLIQEINSHNDSKQRINYLENELQNMNGKYYYATQQLQQQKNDIEELGVAKSSLIDNNNNLIEQLEFTKTILKAKETENSSLYSQLEQLSRELEVSKLQLQQLLNGSTAYTSADNSDHVSNRNEEQLQKIDNLEQQLKMAQKEKDQINIHYEHYVGELNEQLKLMISKNEELSKQIYHLSNRESSLVEQISEMEIRIQNLQVKILENNNKVPDEIIDVNALQNEYRVVQNQLQEMTQKYEKLQNLYKENEAKVIELQEAVKTSHDHDSISVSKLTADITSDKIAAQRATEQNKILKTRMQELEEAFVKMTQDKLQLTEKNTAEKFLNRELTIKLAECEDKCKEMHVTLKAKDDEMIRLQHNYRDLEREYTELCNKFRKEIGKDSVEVNNENSLKQVFTINDKNEENILLTADENNHTHEPSCLVKNEMEKADLRKEDAMIKLQERFLKIMSDVADLSDEKHRLEHIILQLQNETDTICEYVALYQQQRSLLKKRDEERSSQIKLFQIECDRLKRELEELSGILIRFADDKELAMYFQVESRKKDIEKVRSLLFNLKSNSLVDPHRLDIELSKVYPCNCCSGNLIEV